MRNNNEKMVMKLDANMPLNAVERRLAEYRERYGSALSLDGPLDLKLVRRNVVQAEDQTPVSEADKPAVKATTPKDAVVTDAPQAKVPTENPDGSGNTVLA